MNVASKLVWTSDPEAAKKLREEGKFDVATDVDPSKQTIRVRASWRRGPENRELTTDN